MIFRLSQKLRTRIKAGTLSILPSPANPFVDWSAHSFSQDRTQYIILSNTKSLYSTVLYGKGITNSSHFIGRALSSIREFMSHDGTEPVFRALIAPTTGTIRFGTALNRTVTGSINELIAEAKLLLADGDISPVDVGFRLNEMLLSALGRNKAGAYGRPRDALKKMVRRMSPSLLVRDHA